MSAIVSLKPDLEIERPDEAWKYPYVAGAVDFKAGLKVGVQKASDTAVGYQIVPEIHITNRQKLPLGFLDEFCVTHDLHPRLREMANTNRLEISRRDDVRDFLALVYPYLIGKSEAAEIMLKRLIPGLENREHSTEEGFLHLMYHVDQIRELTHSRSDVKYTQDYFRDEFSA